MFVHVLKIVFLIFNLVPSHSSLIQQLYGKKNAKCKRASDLTKSRKIVFIFCTFHQFSSFYGYTGKSPT